MVLFANKEDCCGCGACVNICDRNAVSMQCDEEGFIYPVIDEKMCVECGRCISVCNFKKKENQRNVPLDVYAGQGKDKMLNRQSSSGGIFGILARYVIEQEQGVVYGAVMDISSEDVKVYHKKAETKDELFQMHGSKYVQSSTEYTYKDVEKRLKCGQTVLYSGTPCQIDGLKGFLRKDYDNLITVELICHGVPSNVMFKSYIAAMNDSWRGKIQEFHFRDKSYQWGYSSCLTYITNDNRKIKRRISCRASSYYYYFLKAEICRESCYQCKYAADRRVADITLGDFWGIDKEHPELLKNELKMEEGVSAILVNTQKGRNLMEKSRDSIRLYSSELKKVTRHNQQLLHAVKKGKHRSIILKRFREEGYRGVERYFLLHHWLGIMKGNLKLLILSMHKKRMER